MLNELQRTFIEEATSELYDIAAPPETRCGWCAYSGAIKGTHRDYLVDHRIGPYHDFSVRRSEEDQHVPVEYHDQAVYLLGALETINGPIEEIVKAAADASPRHVHGLGDQCDTSCMDGAFPLANFFRAIARERLGIGKVSETFGRIELPADPDYCDGCGNARGMCIEQRQRATICCHGCSHSGRVHEHVRPRPFTVPRLNTEGGA